MLPILYFGMKGHFSLLPLVRLLAAGVPVVGVVVPAEGVVVGGIRPLPPPAPTPSEIPLLTPYMQPNIIHLAWQHGIPVYEVSDLGDEGVLTALQPLQPAVACVVCFSKRIPHSLLEWPTRGFWNVHPSLLPQYRGPEPIFWVLREGGQAGVTVHQMDVGMDTGVVLAQQALRWPLGASRKEIETLCAEAGVTLLLECLVAAERETLVPMPQVGTLSYFRMPTTADFVIDKAWSGVQAFNFMRGTVEWEVPYRIETGDGVVVAKTAVAFVTDAFVQNGRLGEGMKGQGIHFADGVLWIE